MSTTTILHHTTTFLTQLLTHPARRHRILHTLQTPNLLTQTLETAITNPTSIQLPETLLLSCPETPFSLLVLSLVYTLSDRHLLASIAFLELFKIHPFVMRSEVAPQVFEEMFLRHFVPVLDWYNEQRSRILSSLCLNNSECENLENCESDGNVSIVSCVNLLSGMNDNQAVELKELEREYEMVLDENCRVFVEYFKEVLRSEDGSVIDPPDVVLEVVDKRGECEFAQGEKKVLDKFGSKNGRYNVMFV